MAGWVLSAKCAVTGFQASTSTATIPVSSAASTAQMAAILLISCTTGAALPITEGANSWLAP